MPEATAPYGATPGEHRPPKFRARAYHCPYCAVLNDMSWRQALHHPFPAEHEIRGVPVGYSLSDVWLARCENCHARQIWIDRGVDLPKLLVSPKASAGPPAHPEMPADVKRDYDEARHIAQDSPRGACALLRVACERLVEDLQPEGRDLNDRIGKLVAAGLPVLVKHSMDTLRIIGGQAVHPAMLDLRDDVDTTSAMFALVNIIVEDRIAQPRRVQAMHDALPAPKLEGIARRDAPPPEP